MNSLLASHICVFNVIVFLVGMSEAGGRPYLRSNLARTMYNRMVTDERLRNLDLAKLYEIDELALTDDVRQRFVQLSLDEETQQFLDGCFQQSEWLLTQIWHSVAKAFLGMFMTQTSVNGLLSRGRMFVWSEAQARQLLGHRRPNTQLAGDHNWIKDDQACPATGQNPSSLGEAAGPGPRDAELGRDVLEECPGAGAHAGYPEGDLWVGDRLLDLGAGDGYVTRVLGGGASQVDVTEASPVMRHRLRERGYRVLDTWAWQTEVEDSQYDVVTCLNLLDRCDTPRTLLKDIHAKLASDGALIVALVLPFSPYVEIGTIDNLPSEELGVSGSTIEEQVNSLAADVFPSLGYKLERWSRLPYLCEGDLDQAFYWLSDVVLVLAKEDGGSPNITLEDSGDQYGDALDQVASGLGKINI